MSSIANVTPGEIALIQRLVAAEAEDSEDQLTESRPGGWWLGDDQIDGRVAWRLLRHALIKEDCVQSGGITYYHVTECGRNLAARPKEYVPCTVRHLRGESGPFSCTGGAR